MACSSCLMAWHEFCERPDHDKDDCCCHHTAVHGTSNDLLDVLAGDVSKRGPKVNRNDTLISDDEISDSLDEVVAALATIEPDELPTEREYSDSVASGRKRAVNEHRIVEGTPCEWRALLRAGGGVAPIVGCRPEDERQAKHIHHGPDKSTANNAAENVHRICVFCHNRWHTANDPYYGDRPADNSTYLPKAEFQSALQVHDKKTKASPEELERNEQYWKTRKVKSAPKNEHIAPGIPSFVEVSGMEESP